MGNPRYTDADKAAALEVLKAEGLPAAAKSAGCSKSTIIRWAKAAGLDPSAYAERSTEQNKAAAAASVASRRRAMVDRRIAISDLLLEQLAPEAAAILADRLAEERATTELVKGAAERLELAITGLGAIVGLIEEAKAEGSTVSAEQLANLEEQRKAARAHVTDAKVILEAHRAGRIKVPELVGVLTRAIADHLTLEGDAEAAAAHDGTGFTVILSAPRPNRLNQPEPVQLQAEEAHP